MNLAFVVKKQYLFPKGERMKWLLLSIGIIAELVGSTCMKMSVGFTKMYPSIFTFVSWGVGLTVFMFALKEFDLSFAYAIWAGLGILFFKEPYNMMKIISILLVAIGVIALNISDVLMKK